jgi:Mg2+ and Co2+ transporter CorA
MMKEFEDLDKRLALLEQKLDLVLNNHLRHIEKDMAWIKKFMGGIATVVLIEAGYIIAKFNGMM